MTEYKFNKNEKLCSKKAIAEILQNNYSINAYPLKLLWNNSTFIDHTQILIVVPKKKIKKANKRNLLKRRIREAFRKNKHILFNTLDTKTVLALVYIYVDKEIASYSKIEDKIIVTLKKLAEKHEKIA
jgi:ribonuclease P protein component